LIDLHVDFLGFGKDRDGRGARVDTTLAFGLGHTLHPVRTAFVLEAAPGVRAFHEERHVAKAAMIGRLA
jgi:hypothetical protein